MYTDASKSERGVSFAVVLNRTAVQHELPDITSIIYHENFAIIETIKLANSLQSTIILTTSDFTTLKNAHPNNVTTRKTRAELFSTHKNIEFTWILSHIRPKGITRWPTKQLIRPTEINLTFETLHLTTCAYPFVILLSWKRHWDSVPPTNRLKSIKNSVKQRNFLKNLTTFVPQIKL